MSKLPITTAAKLEKLLLLLGFISQRKKGSHIFYRHPDGRYTTIPHHSGKDIPRELLRAILKQINISVDEFVELLNKV